MKLLSKIMLFAIAAMLGFVFSSCSKEVVDKHRAESDESDENVVYKVYLDYSVVCSEDLLEFANPIVSYVDANGASQTKKLTRADFGESTIEGETDLEWNCPRIEFDSLGIQHEMTVKYEIKSLHVEEGRNYTMSHTIRCSVTPQRKTTTSKWTIITNIPQKSEIDNTVNNINENDWIKASAAVAAYMTALHITPDRLAISVDKDGKVDFSHIVAVSE